MYKGILLDIDNTLYEYEPIHEVSLANLYQKLEQGFGKSRGESERAFERAKSCVKSDLPETAASHNRLLYVQKMCEFLEINALQNSLELYESYWSYFLEHMLLTQGAKEFFLKSKGTPICLLTDLTAHIQHRKVAKLGLSRYTKYMVTSEEAGCEKPHPYMFHLALTKLGLKANEVCMIGDSYKKDIQGAARLGIHGYWLNTNGKSQPAGFNSSLMTEIQELTDISWL